MKIGENIKKLRKERGITQEKLAENLGISFQAVSKWENETAMPDITLVPLLASFFGVTTDYLLDYKMPSKFCLEVVKPKNDDDVKEIIKLLRLNKTVVINCENIDYEIIQKISDNIANNIIDVKINRLAGKTVICTPKGVEI